MESPCIDPIIREQLANQLVAVMDAHFTRPTDDQKREILQTAERQIMALRRLAEDQLRP